MTAKDRLKEFISKKGITKYNFCCVCNFSNSFLESGSGVHSDKLQIIHEQFPELNLHWVITGEGEMLRTRRTHIHKDLLQALENHNRELLSLIAIRNNQVDLLKEEIEKLKEEL